MKKTIVPLCLFFAMLFSTNLYALSSGVSWYCVRSSDHTQPKLSKELSFAEEYDLYWCDKENSDFNSEDKVIYLTFDAGYENGNIRRIVEALKEEDVKATFFILDNMIIKNKDLVREIIDNGHTVANHTLKHRDLTNVKSIDEFKKELSSLEELYESTYGEKMPKLYRPPEGKISEENLRWAKELGYTAVMWSFAYADWDNEKQPTQAYAMKKILDNLHNGEIMLLHPTSDTNAKIMKELIQHLKSMGYRFGTIEELCAKQQ